MKHGHETSEGAASAPIAFFGRMGEVAYDADEDRVECHLCGNRFQHLGGSPESRLAR